MPYKDPRSEVAKASNRKARLKYDKTEKGKRNKQNCALRSNFGLTLEQYDKMLKDQNGVCAVCKQPEQTSRYGTLFKLSVDHSHETQKLRGLLCNTCNRFLGLAGDSIETLQAAILYLKQYSISIGDSNG